MTLSTLHPAVWACAIVAALFVGMSKAGFSGVTFISIILMAHIFPPRESTGAILPMLITADICAVWIYYRYANGRLVVRLLLPAVVGVIVGWRLMPVIPTAIFGPVIGWIILALLVLTLVQKLRPALLYFAAEHPAVAWFFGFLAGVTTMLANAAGPVMTMYLLVHRLPKLEFVATGAWFFLAINLIKVPFSASLGLINETSLLFNLLLAPAVVLGVFLGRWLLRHINQNIFEWTMIVLTFLGALRLLAR